MSQIADLITTNATDIQGAAVAASILFRYDSADPFCVTLDCTALDAVTHRVHGSAPPSAPNTWGFSRNLLTDAVLVDGRFGLHDVIVERSGPVLTITLSSPDGAAHLRFGLHAVLRFVQRTAMLVPLGHESEHLDVDIAIAKLLGGVS